MMMHMNARACHRLHVNMVCQCHNHVLCTAGPLDWLVHARRICTAAKWRSAERAAAPGQPRSRARAVPAAELTASRPALAGALRSMGQAEVADDRHGKHAVMVLALLAGLPLDAATQHRTHTTISCLACVQSQLWRFTGCCCSAGAWRGCGASA